MKICQFLVKSEHPGKGNIFIPEVFFLKVYKWGCRKLVVKKCRMDLLLKIFV